MTEPYKTQQEIFAALDEGKVLIDSDDIKIKYTNGFLTSEDGIRWNSLPDVSWGWREYIEPKWYENIPEGGVIGFVSDNEEVWFPTIILSYEYPAEYPFETAGVSWRYARFATKAEIQQLLDNAPEA